MRVLFVGDAISGKVILEEIKKVGALVALAVPDRDQEQLLNNELLTIKISKINDGWTVVTQDHELSAQYEHTVLVTEKGFDILTIRPDEDINEYK